jgi:hypothetical protein
MKKKRDQKNVCLIPDRSTMFTTNFEVGVWVAGIPFQARAASKFLLK